MSMKKPVWFFAICIFCSFLLGIFFAAFEIKGVIYYTISFLFYLFLVGKIIYDYMVFNKKYQSMINILYQELDPDRFMEENETFFQVYARKKYQSLRDINTAVAYTYKEEYEKALQYFSAIEARKLPKKIRFVYFADIAYIYFKQGKCAEGVRILEEEKILLKRNWFKDKYIQNFLDVLEIFKSIYEKDISFARGKYKQLSDRVTAYNEKDIQYLGSLLEEKKEEEDK